MLRDLLLLLLLLLCLLLHLHMHHQPSQTTTPAGMHVLSQLQVLAAP